MLPKKNRLEREYFRPLFQKGKRINFDSFTLIYSDYGVFKENKFGIVVSSTVSKKSVLRNKLKRRARMIILKLSESFVVPRGIVIVFKKQVLAFSFCEIECEIKNAFLKVGF